MEQRSRVLGAVLTARFGPIVARVGRSLLAGRQPLQRIVLPGIPRDQVGILVE